MSPDWRLFHVRISTGKRLFFEVPLIPLSGGDVQAATRANLEETDPHRRTAHDLQQNFMSWDLAIQWSTAVREALLKVFRISSAKK